jgi:hypothetical protein
MLFRNISNLFSLKVQFSLYLTNHHAMMYEGVEVQLHEFITCELEMRCTPWTLYPQYPLPMRLGGTQSQSRHGSKQKKSLSLKRIEYQLSNS